MGLDADPEITLEITPSTFDLYTTQAYFDPRSNFFDGVVGWTKRQYEESIDLRNANSDCDLQDFLDSLPLNTNVSFLNGDDIEITYGNGTTTTIFCQFETLLSSVWRLGTLVSYEYYLIFDNLLVKSFAQTHDLVSVNGVQWAPGFSVQLSKFTSENDAVRYMHEERFYAYTFVDAMSQLMLWILMTGGIIFGFCFSNSLPEYYFSFTHPTVESILDNIKTFREMKHMHHKVTTDKEFPDLVTSSGKRFKTMAEHDPIHRVESRF